MNVLENENWIFVKIDVERGEVDSHMKGAGMLVVSLRGVNFGFWSHFGCSGQNAIIFILAVKVLFRMHAKKNSFCLLDSYNQSFL